MSSNTRGDAAYPAVPPTLQHDSVELTDLDKSHARRIANTAPGITPYLGLRARLSQVWFNRWTILLILVLVRVLIMISGLNDDLGDAKTKALASCSNVEDMGSAMASMPHYLSVGVNRAAADGITFAVSGLVAMLNLILTAVEQLIIFVINMYVGTYACLIAAFVHGGLDVSVGVVNGTVNFFNNNIGQITQVISDDAGKVQSAINDVIKTVNSLGSMFGKTFTAPTIDFTDQINSLKNIHVDDTQFVKDLVTLNTTLPTFDDVEKAAKEAISFPFEMVRGLLNSTYANYSFDNTVFPVAEKQSLSFCSNNTFLNDFFTMLYDTVAKAKIAFIVVLAVLAVLACIPMALLEIRRWRSQKRHAEVFTKHGFDPMDVVYISSRPMTATFGIKIASRFSGKRQLLVRWAVAYATSLPAIFVLSLAIAGLFSCLCQWITLRVIQAEAPALANEVGDFANEVVTTLENVSVKWANDANGVITGFDDKINNDILAYVVNATSAVNNTLNTFEDDMNKAIDTVFQNTILYNTVKDVIKCLIGMKIDAVESGLTWVHDHAHVSFPLFANDTFSAGASDSIHGDSELTSFLATPSSVTTDEITGAVDHVTDMLHNNIVQEALVSLALLAVYVIVVLVGIIRSLVSGATPDRTRGEGGSHYVTADQYAANAGGLTGDRRAPLSPRSPRQRSASVGGGARFPRFGGGGSGSNGSHEDDLGANAGDETPYGVEKGGAGYYATAASERTKNVRGGKGGMRSPGHWRSSSYGEVQDVKS